MNVNSKVATELSRWRGKNRDPESRISKEALCRRPQIEMHTRNEHKMTTLERYRRYTCGIILTTTNIFPSCDALFDRELQNDIWRALLCGVPKEMF